ncbi:NAD(P)/FAD-dependent oxidoreductase, partial [Mycolicibacterium litorale]
SIETQVEWSTDLIEHVEQTGYSAVEPTADAEQDWTATCREIADATLFPKAQSWIFGANIPGKKNTVYFYLAGLGAYRNVLSECKDAGYKGFQFS